MSFDIPTSMIPMAVDKSELTPIDQQFKMFDKHIENGEAKHTTAIKIVFVVGAPGSGKGTLCSNPTIESKLQFLHLSLGDYFRYLRDQGHILPSEALAGLKPKDLDECMKNSQLMDADQIVGILRYKIEMEEAHGWKRFIVDGFPRTLQSAELFDEVIGEPALVINVQCEKEKSKARFLARARETADSGKKFETRYAQHENANLAICQRYSESLVVIDTNDDSDRGKEQSHQDMVRYLEQSHASVE